jgi:hypothetical protein
MLKGEKTRERIVSKAAELFSEQRRQAEAF